MCGVIGHDKRTCTENKDNSEYIFTFWSHFFTNITTNTVSFVFILDNKGKHKANNNKKRYRETRLIKLKNSTKKIKPNDTDVSLKILSTKKKKAPTKAYITPKINRASQNINIENSI